MNKHKIPGLIISHGLIGIFGFAVGIYMLPILTAPPAPSTAEIESMSSQAQFTAEFKKDLEDSDTFHWGEGKVSIGSSFITLMGRLAPGPDYKLYLSNTYVETEKDFNRLKSTMAQVGDVKTFENFAVKVPENINPSDYNSVIVWCESFGEFITSARYQ